MLSFTPPVGNYWIAIDDAHTVTSVIVTCTAISALGFSPIALAVRVPLLFSIQIALVPLSMSTPRAVASIWMSTLLLTVMPVMVTVWV